tara:strand:- start:376 stop:594 length:219 start_codon:yes stop_codon:yes gene_type:complete
MADKKKEAVDPIIEAAKQAEVIEEQAEKLPGLKSTKPPAAEMTIEEIIAAEKAKIRAAELKKQDIVEKKRKQ